MYFSVFIAGTIISFVVLECSIALSKKFNYIDYPNVRKSHKQPVPYGGGVAIFVSFVIMAILSSIIIQMGWAEHQLTSKIYWSSLLKDAKTYWIAFGTSSIFLLGLIDDIVDLKAKTKLWIQLIVVSMVIHFGDLQLSFFVQFPEVGFIGTLLWIVFITNAFNLLDNTDGICSGVTLVVLGVNFLLLYFHQQYVISLLTIFIMAPLFIFFFYNKPPAKVYLGDAGSLMLGFLVAMLSILSTYYREGQHLSSILTPVLIMMLPIFDVLTVMYIRYRAGHSFFKADRNHFAHRLLNLGLSPMQTLMTMCGISFVMGLAALMLSECTSLQAVYIFIQTLTIVLIILVLEKAGSKHRSL